MTLTAQPRVRRPKASLWALRIILLLHTALVGAQPILAGYFLAGEVDAMDAHGRIGSTVWMTGFLQVVIAGVYWLGGGGRPWPLLWSAVLVVAEFVQLTFGYLQNFAVHVPLGTAIVAVVIWMTIWSFRPAARRGRQEVKQ
ncbi:hypothetical protein GCM10029976_074740 [Kribbella albertanoniae]|uniref:Uncharacterized protein n=1 Tax=Kribbella albertanoniae TaxID=1266829 RepID=A0A4R4QB17_9ACTN|nr:hypothetical protein [Kribbella albertanoniae]TDC32611.1 hypothetical protein E1261_08200 [Kribbella albertanoniae]